MIAEQFKVPQETFIVAASTPGLLSFKSLFFIISLLSLSQVLHQFFKHLPLTPLGF